MCASLSSSTHLLELQANFESIDLDCIDDLNLSNLVSELRTAYRLTHCD
jgi:hypothetical protein